MAELENVIKSLECIIWEVDHNLMWLPGDDDIRDAIVLLKEQQQIIRCKDCKHRPIKPDGYENGFDLEFPDGKCPCQCDDGWYSWFPSDDWFCANGELAE